MLAPRAWGTHAITVLAVVAAAWLGIWQLHAWQAQREAATRDLTHARPVPLPTVLGPDDPLSGDDLGRPVTVEGTWLPTEVTVRRPSGFWDVGFLQTSTGSAIPVVLGWNTTPGLSTAPARPAGGVTGWLQPTQDVEAGAAPPSGDVLAALRIADLVQRVDVDLYGAYLVADHSQGQDVGWAGLRQAHLEQQPSAGSWAGLRNLFYAIEWWFFAGFAIVLWGKWIRDETREQPTTEDAVPSNA